MLGFCSSRTWLVGIFQLSGLYPGLTIGDTHMKRLYMQNRNANVARLKVALDNTCDVNASAGIVHRRLTECDIIIGC